jgi:UDP-3-O-[3-hydroxymyristoyl] glucosamine N-acyltransferase
MTDRTPLATTGDLADLLGADLVGPRDLPIFGVAGLDEAAAGELSFVRSPKYAGRWARSRAGSAVVTRGIEVPGHDAETRALLFVDDADRAMITMLHAAQERAPRVAPEPGVHPGAHIDATASIPGTASVGAGAVIGAGAPSGSTRSWAPTP